VGRSTCLIIVTQVRDECCEKPGVLSMASQTSSIVHLLGSAGRAFGLEVLNRAKQTTELEGPVVLFGIDFEQCARGV
jgi:hypothetical protein